MTPPTSSQTLGIINHTDLFILKLLILPFLQNVFKTYSQKNAVLCGINALENHFLNLEPPTLKPQ
jgi:hypothetical protein